MQLTTHVLVVLGLAACAVVGAMAMAALLLGVGVDGVASQLLMAVAGAGGAVVGARANLASGRLLRAERAADLA